MEGEQAVSSIVTSSPNSKPELSGGTADLECDVADEFSSASARHTGSPTKCQDYQIEKRGSLTPHKSTDWMQYDPCNSVFVRPATELEKADADLAHLRQQLVRLKPAVARRTKADPRCPIARDYQLKAREMELALERAERRRASVASFYDASVSPCGGSTGRAAFDHRRGESTCSTSEPSSLSWSDFGVEEASGVASPSYTL